MRYCLEGLTSIVAWAEFILSLIDGNNLFMRHPEKNFVFQ